MPLRPCSMALWVLSASVTSSTTLCALSPAVFFSATAEAVCATCSERGLGAITCEEAVPTESTGVASHENMLSRSLQTQALRERGSGETDCIKKLSTCARPRPKQQVAVGRAPRQDRSYRRQRSLPGLRPCLGARGDWRAPVRSLA